MKGQVTIGRPFGVEVALHFSWFLIAALILLSLAQRFREAHADWASFVIWATATVTAALFFAALVLHELSHALVARAHGLPVHSITLFALGGVARISREAADAKTELLMAGAGPVASALIGVSCLFVARLLGWQPPGEAASPLLSVLVWLGYINGSLAVFNLIPAFPMDGGRILRAAIWWITGDLRRATRWAARLGQLMAVGFIGLGVFSFLFEGGLGGLWISFIGWFLLNAAGASYQELQSHELLRGLRVEDVMLRDCIPVDGRTSVQEFVDRLLLRLGARCFVVTGSGRVLGLVTIHEIKHVPREAWLSTSVDSVMQPLDRLHTVSPASPLSESVEIMGRDDLQQLPVLEEGRLLGVVSRNSVAQLMRTRAELHL
jgi:Zn-dependent protease/CBS domain-containing protein